jgi:hypothetical protein
VERPETEAEEEAGTVPTLTPTEIYQVCLTAGFNPDQAVTWTAIALAESGGNTDAHNPSGEDSWGLWQINVDPAVRPNHWGDLTDPVNNARAALEISGGGTNLRPWTVTHASNQGTSHDYREFMEEARAAAGGAYLGDFSGVTGYDDPLPMGTGPDAPPGGRPAPAPTVQEADTDLDGAPDSFEMSHGTDPRVPDTEHDGLTDGFEAFIGTDAGALDTDIDGLSDGYEVEVGSNPLLADSDSDTVGDSLELASGSDPSLGFAPGTEVPAVDSDTDGLSDAVEAQIGSDPLSADTDGDHIGDALEQAQGTDALRVDSDDDGILDDADADPLRAAFGVMLPGAAAAPAIPGLPAASGSGLPGPGFQPPGFQAPGPDGTVMPVGGVELPPLAGAPAATGPAPGEEVAPGRVRDFLDLALAQTGDSYVFGGEAPVSDADPEVFDCSELVQWAGGRVGVELPDGSWLQYLELERQGAIIPVDEAVHTPGALLFSFDREPTPGGGRPGSAHVAISLGDGNTIEARGTQYGVGTWETGDRFQYAAVIPELGGGDLVAAAALAEPPVGGVAGPPVAAPDTDLDGAPDDFEMSRGLDPARPDSDDDGLMDGFELALLTDPLAGDSDRDGLSDAFEVQAHLDPMRADSDGDGMTDAYELAAHGEVGAAPAMAMAPRTLPDGTLLAAPDGAVAGGLAGAGGLPGATAIDSDADGLSNAWESTLGTNPLHADSDGDSISDALEVAQGGDPLLPDDEPDDDPVDP